MSSRGEDVMSEESRSSDEDSECAGNWIDSRPSSLFRIQFSVEPKRASRATRATEGRERTRGQ